MDSQKSLFCKYGPWKRFLVYFALATVGNSSGDNTHFCNTTFYHFDKKILFC